MVSNKTVLPAPFVPRITRYSPSRTWRWPTSRENAPRSTRTSESLSMSALPAPSAGTFSSR